MLNPAIKIHHLRVRLHTSRTLAGSLQQAVSQAVNTRLTDEVVTGLTSVTLWPHHIARLTLDLGELPYEGFERQFVQRLVRQLSEALDALPPPEEVALSELANTDDIAAAPQRADEERTAAEEVSARQTRPSLSAVTPATGAVYSVAALSACLLRFWHTGYWPYAPYTEGESAVAVRGPLADRGENVWGNGPEGAIAPGKEEAKRCALGPAGSPSQVLAQLLSVQLAPDAKLLTMLAPLLWRSVARRRIWQCLGEQTRRQLFDFFTSERRQVSVPQLADISPAGLMLAAWHYALQPSSIVVWHGGQHENHQALAALTPVETDWLDALLVASARHPVLLSAVLPPLRRYAGVWGARLSGPAQQLWQGSYVPQSGGNRSPSAKQSTPSLPAGQVALSHTPRAGERGGTVAEAGHIEPDGQRRPAAKDREPPASTVPHIEKGREVSVPSVPDADEPRPPAQGGPGEPEESLPPQLHVSNAGIVLLWPLLPRLFTQMDLLEKTQQDAPYRFINQQTQQRAVGVLDALIWADDAPAEWRCMVNKWLCNWPLSAPLADGLPESEATRAFLNGWLSTLRVQIPGLQHCEPDELRALFLQRPGMMQEERHGWRLMVEPHPSDIMLAKLPWPLQQLTLPWLAEPLAVTWQLPRYPIF
jgi:hypothetical protein